MRRIRFLLGVVCEICDNEETPLFVIEFEIFATFVSRLFVARITILAKCFYVLLVMFQTHCTA